MSASMRVVEGQVQKKVSLSGLVEKRPGELQNPRDVPPDLVYRVVLLGLRKVERKSRFWTDVLFPDNT